MCSWVPSFLTKTIPLIIWVSLKKKKTLPKQRIFWFKVCCWQPLDLKSFLLSVKSVEESHSAGWSKHFISSYLTIVLTLDTPCKTPCKTYHSWISGDLCEAIFFPALEGCFGGGGRCAKNKRKEKKSKLTLQAAVTWKPENCLQDKNPHIMCIPLLSLSLPGLFCNCSKCFLCKRNYSWSSGEQLAFWEPGR